MMLLVGFDDHYDVTVTAECEVLEPYSMVATYDGNKEVGTVLNKDDFAVYLMYRLANGDLVEGDRLSSDDFTITPDSITTDEVTQVTVESQGLSCIVPIYAIIGNGNLIIKTVNIEAEVTVEAVTQEGDDLILKRGYDVVYTISCEDKGQDVTDAVVNTLNNFNNETNKVSILQAYDIKMKREVEGQSSGLISVLAKQIYLTLNIPEDYRDSSAQFYIAHEHGNSLELLQDLDDNPNTITVNTKSFSNYVLYKVNKIEAQPTPTPTPTPTPSTPKKTPIPVINTPHVHKYRETTKPATCLLPSTKDMKCIDCSYSLHLEVAPPLGHDWNEEDNYSVCKRCGLRVDNTIDKFWTSTDYVNRTFSKVPEKSTSAEKEKPYINLNTTLPVNYNTGSNYISETNIPQRIEAGEEIVVPRDVVDKVEFEEPNKPEVTEADKLSRLATLSLLFFVLLILGLVIYYTYKKFKEKK